MTEDDFRRIALSLPDAVESAHNGHPDFRVGGKIFASLQPGRRLGMAKLTPEQQTAFATDEPNVFAPVNGSWGLKGATYISLDRAEEDSVRMALEAAIKNTATGSSQNRPDKANPGLSQK
jgi:hypothetical protein